MRVRVLKVLSQITLGVLFFLFFSGVPNAELTKIKAQIPQNQINFPQSVDLQTPSLVNNLGNRVSSGWIHLDGQRIFQLSAPRSNLSERLANIQNSLNKISESYFESVEKSSALKDNRSPKEINIEINTVNGLRVIFVNGEYLLTVTEQDARQQQLNPLVFAQQIKQKIRRGLEDGVEERQGDYLVEQGKLTVLILLSLSFISFLIIHIWKRLKKGLKSVIPISRKTESITTQFNQNQYDNLKEVLRRSFQLSLIALWVGGTYYILGLFPHTRSLQLKFLILSQIPLKLVLLVLLAYIAIRLSYVLIDRFSSVFIHSGALLTPEVTQRLQLRISTISNVLKGIVTCLILALSILLFLTILGVDIVPLLAGASLIGIAVSLASQNLIKDAINGFFIVLEDQYALGDVINVGDVGGLVENLNLRITQLRDSEGRLITIPNSEVKIVANLSSRWSRVDLNIPVNYETNIDQALELIDKIGLRMEKDDRWKDEILETPTVLGVDNFGDIGLIIKVWIKTQPLKQWSVAREYRRRVKVAFDKEGILIPQAIWMNEHGSRQIKDKSNS